MKYQIGGFSNVFSQIGNSSNTVSSPSTSVGKVYGVVTTENTPTEAMFNKAGGFSGIGTVFYLDYESSKYITGSLDDPFLNKCKLAIPFNSNIAHYPLRNELVSLSVLPSSATQNSPSSIQAYYLGVINLWNNNQQNSQPASDSDSLGSTFDENPNIRSLLPFQGDHILQGRQGNALRFSTTTKLRNTNNWSAVGKNTDPITILTNGFNYDPSGSYHIENINIDLSSIYLTSAQKIPLEVNKTGILNPVVRTTDITKYENAQVIINSDRVVLNSKKDDIMVFAKNNINLNTKNIINLNADERVHLNSSKIYLGIVNNDLPTEPILLGQKTHDLLLDLMERLHDFGVDLAEAIASPEGSPSTDIVMAASTLCLNIDRIEGDLEGILSQQNFTA